MKKVYFLFFCLVFSLSASAQQDANFSQYIFNTIHINPAYAGYKNNIYLQSNYRKQWTGVEGAPETFSLSGDMLLMNEKVGLSLMVNKDKIGVQNDLSIYGGYAYHVYLNQENSKISFGINAGFLQTSLNGNLFDPNDSGDDYIPISSQSNLLPDARFGVLFSNATFFTGISASNILSNFSFGKKKSDWYIGLKPHLYLLGGMILNVSDDIILKPMALLKDDFGGPTNLDLNGFILLREKIWLGAMYRTGVKLYDKSNLQKDLQKSSATGIMMEIFPTQKLRIGYSFDYSLNKLRGENNGTHEISIGLYLRDLNNTKNGFTGCYF